MTEPRFITLGRWYATPLTPNEARALLTRIEAKEKERLRRARSCTLCRMVRLIARFWLCESVEQDYDYLAAHVVRRHSPRARALLELIYGQLLAARRQLNATEHLEKGFTEGKNLLAPADYFVVLKRHSLLRLLPPDESQMPLNLEELLTTARVIERMTGAQSRPSSNPNVHLRP